VMGSSICLIARAMVDWTAENVFRVISIFLLCQLKLGYYIFVFISYVLLNRI